jgi:hypothetical protein
LDDWKHFDRVNVPEPETPKSTQLSDPPKVTREAFSED